MAFSYIACVSLTTVKGSIHVENETKKWREMVSRGFEWSLSNTPELPFITFSVSYSLSWMWNRLLKRIGCTFCDSPYPWRFLCSRNKWVLCCHTAQNSRLTVKKRMCVARWESASSVWRAKVEWAFGLKCTIFPPNANFIPQSDFQYILYWPWHYIRLEIESFLGITDIGFRETFGLVKPNWPCK